MSLQEPIPVLEYTGEFGTEVALFVPFVNYLNTTGYLAANNIRVLTYEGMAPYYFFLNDDKIMYKQQMRVWVPALARSFLPEEIRNDDDIFSQPLRPSILFPPNFVAHYGGSKIHTDLPIMVIQNKYNEEWGGPPVNYIDVPTLDAVVTKRKNSYKIIYIRSNDLRFKGYSNDANEESAYTFGDKEMLREKHPEVIMFEDMLKEFEPMGHTFNTLKCILHANAACTLSTIGGFNYFDAYWPSKHIIYKVDTPPVYTRSFYQNQHNMLCPTPGEVVMVSSASELLEAL